MELKPGVPVRIVAPDVNTPSGPPVAHVLSVRGSRVWVEMESIMPIWLGGPVRPVLLMVAFDASELEVLG